MYAIVPSNVVLGWSACSIFRVYMYWMNAVTDKKQSCSLGQMPKASSTVKL